MAAGLVAAGLSVIQGSAGAAAPDVVASDADHGNYTGFVRLVGSADVEYTDPNGGNEPHGSSERVDATWWHVDGPGAAQPRLEITGTAEQTSWATTKSDCSNTTQTVNGAEGPYWRPVSDPAPPAGTYGFNVNGNVSPIAETVRGCDYPNFSSPNMFVGGGTYQAHFIAWLQPRVDGALKATNGTSLAMSIAASVDDFCTDANFCRNGAGEGWNEVLSGRYTLDVRLTNQCDYDSDGIPDPRDATPTEVTPIDADGPMPPEGGACHKQDECDLHTSFDAFRPYGEAWDEGVDAWLHFDLETVWCEYPDGSFEVISVTPEAYVVGAPNLAEFFLVEAVNAFVVPFRDKWTGPIYERTGDRIEARATVKTCMGIPVLGKIKHLKKLPVAVRGLAKLLKSVDGKWSRVAYKAGGLAERAAKLLDRAIDKGTKAAKFLAQAAIDTLGAAVYAMGYRAQLAVLLATVAVVADWSSTRPPAKWFLGELAGDGGTLLAGKVSEPLGKFLTEGICWNVWRPEIHQTLGTPGQAGEFKDRRGDPSWHVERHTGPF